MPSCNPIFRFVLSATILWQSATIYAATQVIVNSTNNQDSADAELTLPEAIGIVNGGFRALTPAESAQVVTIGGTTNRINFNISGAGPHFITTPDGTAAGALFPLIVASDVVVDGYSQPGSGPNTNPILAANNAVIKIVIDTRTTVNNDGEPALGAIGNNDNFRGLSFLGGANCIGFGSPDPATFPNVGGSIQGCWVGVAPDRTTVVGPTIGTYLYQTGGFQVIGTDGDGNNDRNEFNIFVGSIEMAIGIEADGYATTNIQVSGNFIGVMPDGLTTMPQAALDLVTEGDCLESGGTENLIFGTDADGIADEDERNIVGGIRKAAPGSNDEVFQFWGVTKNAKIMGNYFGVGIDGVTALGNERFISPADGSSAQIGSNGDGVRDAIEANILANNSDYVFRFGGPNTALTFRRNSFSGNTNNFFNDPQNSFNGVLLATGDLAAITPVISNVTTRTELVGWVPVSGPGADNLTPAEIAIYLPDPATSAANPQGKTWLASYRDNGPQDLDPTTNKFRFNICSLAIPATEAQLVVNETAKDDLSAGSSTFSSAVSLPNVPNTLAIASSASSVTLTWQANGILQATPSLSSATWTNVPGCSPVTLPMSPGNLYFRLAQ